MRLKRSESRVRYRMIRFTTANNAQTGLGYGLRNRGLSLGSWELSLGSTHHSATPGNTYLCGYEVVGIALSGMRPRRRMQPTPMPRVVFWGATALKKGSSGTTASPARLSLASGALP